MIQEMLVRCSECNGEGIDLGNFEVKECDFCHGDGQLDEVECDVCGGTGCDYCRQEGVLTDIECPDCRARGSVEIPQRCPLCRGFKTTIPRDLFK